MSNTILADDVCVENNDCKVILTYIGEGYYGDYDENDPEDEPLLRVDLYLPADFYEEDPYDEEDKWPDWLDTADSTCTQLSARSSVDEAQKYAQIILDAITKAIPDIKRDGSVKQALWEAVNAAEKAA